MKIAKIYGLVWFLVTVMAGGAYLMNLFNEITLTIFGLVFSTLAFLGLVAVLPALMDDHYSLYRQAK